MIGYKKDVMFLLVSILIFSSFVFAVHNVVNSGTLGKLFSYAEDVSKIYNITVNNSDPGQIENITSVVITVPSQFIIANNTNRTDAGNNLLIITSTTLNWTNVTQFIVNGSSNQTFVFNASVAAPGHYIISINTLNGSRVWQNNITVEINDTTTPSYIDFVGLTPGNGTGLVRNDFPVNVSVRDNYNISSITIFILNSTQNVINISVNASANASSIYMNFTNYTEGIYYVNASVNDSARNMNISYLRTIYLDRTTPSSIEFGSGTPANGVNQSKSNIDFNISFSDAVAINSVLLEVFNTTGRQNHTVKVINAASYYYNFSYLADGIYYINATVNDSVGNFNSTVSTRAITIDITAPTVSLARASSTTGDTVVININIGEATSGIRTTCTTDRSNAAITGTTTTQTLTETGLTCGASYTYGITCTDRAGNNGGSSITLSTESCSGGSYSSGGSGGSATTWANTYTAGKESLKEGYTKSLGVKERVRVESAGATHYVGVSAVTATTATVNIESTPKIVTLNIGETRKFDVDDNDVYDLSVELISISEGKAKIKILSVEEAKEAVTPADKAAAEAEKKAAAGETLEVEEGLSGTSIGLIVVLVVVLVALVWWFVKKRK